MREKKKKKNTKIDKKKKKYMANLLAYLKNVFEILPLLVTKAVSLFDSSH